MSVLTNFRDNMGALPFWVHLVALGVVFSGLIIAFALFHDRKHREQISIGLFILYLPLLTFYLVQPNLLDFLIKKSRSELQVEPEQFMFKPPADAEQA